MECKEIHLKMELDDIKALEALKIQCQKQLSNIEAALLKKHKLVRDLQNE